MDGVLMSGNEQQQRMVSSFLEIAVGQTADTARQFLQATNWQLEDAIHLFYVGNQGPVIANNDRGTYDDNQGSWGSDNVANENVGDSSSRDDHGSWGSVNVANENDADDGGVRDPLLVVKETLYGDDDSFRNYDEQVKRLEVWESNQDTPLASLYRPPYHLMFHGSFENAKHNSSVEDKWLLVNLQSTKEFTSHMLNRDTWADEAVTQMVAPNFIFLQVYDDTTEGRKVCSYYNLNSVPVVLVIDPITGQKMRSWTGMIHPVSLIEDLVPFMDVGPLATLTKKRPREEKFKVSANEEDEEMLRASTEGCKDLTINDKQALPLMLPTEKPVYPPLPEEPKVVDRNLLCRVGIRLPDGRRVQRSFLCTDPMKLLWSFSYYELEETERKRSFRLAEAIPGTTKYLDYDTNLSFAESGLANSMISVTWE